MIYDKFEYEKDNNCRDKEIFFCNYAIVDLIPNDVWKRVAEDSIEYTLVSMLDKFFTHWKAEVKCLIFKTTMPIFNKCQDGHGRSADVYMTRYGENGETNLLSHSRTALEALLEMSGFGCDTLLQAVNEDKIRIAETK